MAQVASAGQIREKERTVFWVNMAGDIMVAPDTRATPLPGYHRIECSTVAETEAMSRRMALQEFNRMRSMKVEEHLRTKKKRDEIIASCRLRLAKGCISEADEAANRLIIQRMERAENSLYNLLATEPDLSRASLEIEKYDSGTIKARAQGKRAGLADHEIDLAARIMEGVR